MNWETVIGLETHVELATKSKSFCACTTAFGGAPNTHCCPVCTGMPGALPVLNGKVVEYAVRAALALGCTVTSTPICPRPTRSPSSICPSAGTGRWRWGAAPWAFTSCTWRRTRAS